MRYWGLHRTRVPRGFVWEPWQIKSESGLIFECKKPLVLGSVGAATLFTFSLEIELYVGKEAYQHACREEYTARQEHTKFMFSKFYLKSWGLETYCLNLKAAVFNVVAQKCLRGLHTACMLPPIALDLLFCPELGIKKQEFGVLICLTHAFSVSATSCPRPVGDML